MTFALRGRNAERIAMEMLKQLRGHLPEHTDVPIHGSTIGPSVGGPQPVETMYPGDPDYDATRRGLGLSDDGRPIHSQTLFQFTATWSPFGFGTWVPFLPRPLATRLAYVDLLETLQDEISRQAGQPWPAQDCRVRSTRQGDDIVLWFEPEPGREALHLLLPIAFAKSEG